MLVPNLIKRWLTMEAEYSLLEISAEAFIEDYDEFIQFWKSTPVLGHFIPCTKDNKPLDKPTALEWDDFERTGHKHLVPKCVTYQEAQSRCKWVGWSIGENGFLVDEFGNSIGLMTEGGGFNFSARTHKIATYGNIITSNIPLHPTVEYGKELKLK